MSAYFTTPIYYVNAEPHLGHAFTTILVDAAARFYRLAGQQVRWQTGTDEHGDKIAAAAAAKGIEPKAYADHISGMFQNTWPRLEVEPDYFIRTTDPKHIELVQQFLQLIYDKGDIYFSRYGGNYCLGCERFYLDRELVDGKCPDHQTEPAYIEEENYFFKMSKYQQALIDHIEKNPDFIRPERYRNEALSFLREPLDDLCISRPKSRLVWGITLPFDDRFVTYVWFDALLNYITGLNWPEGGLYKEYWPGAQHVVAKDILKPHGIYWPTMLMAAGLPLYQRLNVHGYWQMESGKMSKSLGNVVKPLDLAAVYGAEAFRYFLLREMTFGLDAAFSENALVERYNADLANDLGNLYYRVMNMLQQYRQGVVPAFSSQAPADEELTDLAAKVRAEYAKDLHDLYFHKGLARIWELMGEANRYVVNNEPWKLAKDPQGQTRLDHVLRTLLEVLAQVAVMISPVMPMTARKIAASLSLSLEGLTLARLEQGPVLKDQAQAELPEPLFPRIETDKVQAKAAKAEAKAVKAETHAPKPAKGDAPAAPAEIEISDFAKLDLRLATVRAVEPVPKADRLLKLTVDLGPDRGVRTVVAGIALHYQPQDLLGKQVIIVANLKPAKLKGVESKGMLLAASGFDENNKETVRILTLEEPLPPGSKIR